MNGRTWLMAAGALALLTGCVETNGGGYGGGGYGYAPAPSYGYGSSSDDNEPSRSSLGKRGRIALEEGCRERYGVGNHRYEQCLDGSRHSEEALSAGCAKVYAHDPKQLRRCFNGD